MDVVRPQAGASREFVVGRRRPVTVADHLLVTPELLHEGQTLPLVVRPSLESFDLVSWAAAHRAWVREKLHAHGALLFRGCGVDDVEAFRASVAALSHDLMTYRERSSPRTQVADQIYTSTDYPAEQAIFPHNEHSYAQTYPMTLFFWCDVPAETGGETPIGDTRRVLARIPEDVRRRFTERGWMYVRNFGDGYGLPWQTVFQTDDPAAVEVYCEKAGITPEWKSGGRLRTRQVRPVVATHPVTGEAVWFNHATFFHVSTLPASIRDSLLASSAEDDLPNHTYYGDGSPIEPEVMETLRAAYAQEMVMFPWQHGDLLMVDNMLTAHARAPFTGARRVLVALADPQTRPDAAAPAASPAS